MTETVEVGQEGGGMPKCRGSKCRDIAPDYSSEYRTVSQRTQDELDASLGGLADYLRRVQEGRRLDMWATGSKECRIPLQHERTVSTDVSATSPCWLTALEPGERII